MRWWVFVGAVNGAAGNDGLGATRHCDDDPAGFVPSDFRTVHRFDRIRGYDG